METKAKVLVLSVGYGMGHHAAARAVAEELGSRGYEVKCVDPCAVSVPILFAASRRFYHFCVRSAPWIWGITYEQTDNSDWAGMLWLPPLRACVDKLRELIGAWQPDICLCTYPLFAHMLDAINSRRTVKLPYALVVTDALEISRPWATSQAPLICVTDEVSRADLMHRYGISAERIVATGFPVRSVFAGCGSRPVPSAQNLNILYGVFVPLRQAYRDISALATAYPQARVTVVAGECRRALEASARVWGERVRVVGQVADMQPFFAAAHLYIGKAGAATLFEAYASRLPVIVNFALPGQEQGNLRLLLADGAGLSVEGTEGLLQAVEAMLRDGAAQWRRSAQSMAAADRACGALHIADELERRFL